MRLELHLWDWANPIPKIAAVKIKQGVEGEMADGNGADTGARSEVVAPALPPSRILLLFSAEGAADFSFHPQNITPMQLLAAAAWLEWKGKRLLELGEIEKQLQTQTAPKIVLAKGAAG